MKRATMTSYIKVAVSVLFLSSIQYSAADEVDISTNQCQLEVREAMTREGIKALYAGDQKRVDRSCEQGDVGSAIRFVASIGAFSRCARGLDEYIQNNTLSVAEDVVNRAKSLCRRGDLDKAIEEINVEVAKTPLNPAQILSFSASASEVEKGSTVTLSWSTENTNTVMLGTYGKNDLLKVPSSGSQEVSPEETTTYVLMVGQSTKGPTTMKSRKLQVVVTASANETCSIEGELQGEWQRQIQELPTGPASLWTVGVGIYTANSDSPFALSGASVDDLGIYRFKDLSAGKQYTVRPSWDSVPREGAVSCTSGETHKGPTFEITGGPLID